jgi:hypothetical protein
MLVAVETQDFQAVKVILVDTQVVEATLDLPAVRENLDLRVA